MEISNHQALTECIEGTAAIIDVREPAEYGDLHIPGAINIPSTQYESEHFSGYAQKNIYLVCQSGRRANQVRNQLIEDGFQNVFILETQMQHIRNGKKTKGWTVDRQFRMTLGILLALFLVLHFLDVKNGIIIPIILASGLIFTSIIDRCYMRMGIAMLPWNRGKHE